MAVPHSSSGNRKGAVSNRRVQSNGNDQCRGLLQIAASAVTQCQPHVEVHQQGTVAPARVYNGTRVPQAET